MNDSCPFCGESSEGQDCSACGISVERAPASLCITCRQDLPEGFCRMEEPCPYCCQWQACPECGSKCVPGDDVCSACGFDLGALS